MTIKGYPFYTYLVLRTFGWLCHSVISFLKYRGLLVIEGREHLVAAVAEGPVVVTANHPSILETAIIPNLLYPEALEDQRFYLWSMPDEKLFPKPIQLLYWCGRCIVVSREQVTGSLAHAVQVLRDGGSLVVHPEGGRTGSIDRSTGQVPEYRTCERLGRKVRLPSDAARVLLQGAARAGAKVVPLWVEVPDVVNRPGWTEQRQPDWFFDVLLETLRSRRPIRLYIGEPVSAAEVKTVDELARLILKV